MKKSWPIFSILCGASLLLSSANYARAESSQKALERGKYLVTASGCNDCHTPHFPEKAGNVPEAEWLTGVPVGYRGPWGTSYAGNLRLVAANLNQAGFITRLRSGIFMPPMPGHVTKMMHEEDLAAIYQFIRSLGAKGETMPAALPPKVEPKTPWIDFMPHMPAGEQAPAK